MNIWICFSGLEQIWNENNERLSRFLFEIWRFTVVDVFGKFRNNNLKNYGLRPSHYLSTPGLSSDAKFHMTKVVIELIPVFTFTYLLKKV